MKVYSVSSVQNNHLVVVIVHNFSSSGNEQKVSEQEIQWDFFVSLGYFFSFFSKRRMPFPFSVYNLSHTAVIKNVQVPKKLIVMSDKTRKPQKPKENMKFIINIFSLKNATPSHKNRGITFKPNSEAVPTNASNHIGTTLKEKRDKGHSSKAIFTLELLSVRSLRSWRQWALMQPCLFSASWIGVNRRIRRGREAAGLSDGTQHFLLTSWCVTTGITTHTEYHQQTCRHTTLYGTAHSHSAK